MNPEENENNRMGGHGSPMPGNSDPPLRSSGLPLRISVPSEIASAIRDGIKEIEGQSQVRIVVEPPKGFGSIDKDEIPDEKIITIYGNQQSCSTACQMIMKILKNKAEETNRGEMPLKILANSNLVGRLIGRNGSNINPIREQTGAKITVIDSGIGDISSYKLEKILTVEGEMDQIYAAEQLISKNLRQSFENDLASMAPHAMMFPGLGPTATSYPPNVGGPPVPPPPPQIMDLDLQREIVSIYIPNSAVDDIIGTDGSNISDMISSSGATIEVSQRNNDDPWQRKVTIVGTPEAQWKAQYMVFNKVNTGSYAGPQKSQLKVEIYVPSSKVCRIMGKGGQTVREVGMETRTTIKILAESTDSEGETPIRIVGDFYGTQAAQKEIRHLVKKSVYPGASQPPVDPDNPQPPSN